MLINLNGTMPEAIKGKPKTVIDSDSAKLPEFVENALKAECIERDSFGKMRISSDQLVRLVDHIVGQRIDSAYRADPDLHGIHGLPLDLRLEYIEQHIRHRNDSR